MANPEHLAALRRDVKEWNEWRKRNGVTSPDLRGVALVGANLAGANLVDADLSRANLSGATANETNFSSADLSHAQSAYTELRRARLECEFEGSQHSRI